jgi:hypothetical protein
MRIARTETAPASFVQVPDDVKSSTLTLRAGRSWAAEISDTVAEPDRLRSEPVELSVRVRERVVPEAV